MEEIKKFLAQLMEKKSIEWTNDNDDGVEDQINCIWMRVAEDKLTSH